MMTSCKSQNQMVGLEVTSSKNLVLDVMDSKLVPSTDSDELRVGNVIKDPKLSRS